MTIEGTMPGIDTAADTTTPAGFTPAPDQPVISRRAGIATGVAAALTLGLAPHRPAAAGRNQPNIIIINCDDLATTVYEASTSLRRTLESRGLRFLNAIANVPSCGPSRACLFTGRYTQNNGVRSNVAPDGGWHAFADAGNEQDNLAIRLKRAGYRTGLVGKYMNDYELADNTHVPDGWDDWHAWAGRGKYDRYMVNDNGTVSFYDIRDDAANYETDRYTIMAQEFIASSRSRGPFFLYLAPHAPHMPAVPSSTYRGADAPSTGPRTPAVNEADVSDKPSWIRTAPLLSASKLRRSDKRFQEQVRSMQSVDDMLKGVLKTLEDTGQLGNTWIFFTSDNGFFYGEHRIQSGKGALYEEGIRVPFVVIGPGVKPGQLGGNISTVDLAPTILALAGQRATDLDGRSFKSMLTPTSVPERGATVLVQYGPRYIWETTPPPTPAAAPSPAPKAAEEDPLRGGSFYGLRGVDWTYIFVVATGEYELYDNRHDPLQLVNIYPTMSPTAKTRLREGLTALATCRGETCRAISATLPVTLGLWLEMV
ncbi:MAG: sulfatase family protein [Thermomicrobiales bacterium]